MTDFKTMTKKTMTKNKILAGVTTVVALSGFVPAINAASPTATANVGAEVLIQQAITIAVGAPVDFGTIILSAATVVGAIGMTAGGLISTGGLVGEVSLAGGEAVGTMAINSSAGQVNIALGARPTDNGGNITYQNIKVGGTALGGANLNITANGNQNVNLVGGVIDIGGTLNFVSKPTPGTYTSASWLVTVTDI